MSSSNLFAGTASSYAAFRPPYPDQLLELLSSASTGHDRLVDLGCGTGELARPLARTFAEVLAIDPEPSMIDEGRHSATEAGIDNINWMVGTAEAAELPESTDLIAIGSAFHWMDRPLVLRKARRVLAAGGALAVAGGNSTWTGKEPWQEIIVSVLQRFVGPTRRAGDGQFRAPTQPHQVVMAANGFSDVVQYDFRTPYEWTLDGVLGYLRSTSFASRKVLGDRADEFDAVLTDELLKANPSGTYSEVLPFYALIGHPDGE